MLPINPIVIPLITPILEVRRTPNSALNLALPLQELQRQALAHVPRDMAMHLQLFVSNLVKWGDCGYLPPMLPGYPLGMP